MDRFKRVLFGGLLFAVPGCELENAANKPQPCYSDLECNVGSMCHPSTHTCVVTPVADAGVAKDGAANTGATTHGPAVACGFFSTCDDGDPCTKNDTCTADKKCVGTPYSCDDGIECTVDSCSGTGTCYYAPAIGACFINGVCAKKGDVSANNPCQSCIPSTSATSWSSDDTRTCDDGNACTDKDHCENGYCKGAKNDCNDGDPATTDSCDPAAGCKHVKP